jgi:hypothetical protein
MLSNTGGSDNTASGDSSLLSNTTGSSNTAIGSLALRNNVNGTFNIAIGANSGVSLGSTNLTNTISIGNHGWLTGGSNQAIIGNTSTFLIGGNQNWSNISDARGKKGIEEDVKGLEFIMRLRPVTYFTNVDEMMRISGSQPMENFPGKYDIEKIRQTGFLAQEVEKAAIESRFDFDGVKKIKFANEVYALSYSSFVVPLVKAVQEQKQMIDDLQKRIELLEKKIELISNK